MEQSKNSSRRDFIRNTALATAFSFSIPKIVDAAYKKEKNKNSISLSKGDVILFQGDSITDASRKKDSNDANTAAALGSGYAMLAAAQILQQGANKNLTIHNRGISGNKVYQLAERWDKEALDLKPNVLSILVGVNDFWHMIQGRYNGTITTYRDDYRNLLKRTKEKLPDVKLIIGEPYGVTGIKAVNEKWYPAFDEYRNAAKELAQEFKAVFVPYQSVYNEAQKAAPGMYWTADGVHPTLAGAQLMATAWLKAVKI